LDYFAVKAKSDRKRAHSYARIGGETAIAMAFDGWFAIGFAEQKRNARVL
jgi:hypothetical protein